MHWLTERWRRWTALPLLANVAAASGGKVVFFGASLVRNVVLARLLAPADFGAWSLGLVWLQYAQWTHLSILNAFRLDGARLRGGGQAAEVDRLRRLTWTACVLPAVLVGAVAAIVAGLYPDPHFRPAIVMLAGLILPFQFYAFATSCLSVEERFGLLARLQTLYAVVNLVLTVGLTWRWGFAGAVIAQIGSYLAVLLIYRRHFPIVTRPYFDRDLFWVQLQIGLPVGLNGLVYSVFVTIDRTLVVSLLGLAALGQYGMTSLARSSIGLLPDAISEVVYMRLSTRYGETRNVAALVPIAILADRLLALVVAPVIGLAVIWVPWAIQWMLPAYQPGISALQIFLLGLFFLFPVYAGVVLTSIGRAAELLVLYALATTGQAAFIWVGIQILGITGAAAGTLGGGVLVFLLVNGWGFFRAGVRPTQITRHVVACTIPFLMLGLGLGAAAAIGWAAGPSRGWPLAELGASLLFLTVNMPYAAFAALRLRRQLRGPYA
ncbi:MAG: oligosaccharide flippase family protein [Anaerolineales bacterium]|nr:oligosaccharide flippase family protein [Anaerolineales bacterium]